MTNLNYNMPGVKDDEMVISEHIEEFIQRVIFSLGNLVICVVICFTNIKQIVKCFQAPAVGIKFLQFAPGEYFFASLKIAGFCGLLISSPIILYQVFLYILPATTKKEQEILLPITLSSGILFILGLIFSYFFLVPAALNFFITYGTEIIEPFWSFDQYFNFIAILIFTTGLAFQIPIIQVVVGFLGIISGQKMLSAWKYIVIGSTALAAIITPSTDPITQIIMSSALLILYFGGLGIVFLFNK
jgi:sec-independent protein translocase protein TatC